MNIGICDNPDKTALMFYENNYEVLRTPDFDESTRTLKPAHKIKYLGNSKKKICRFCGKSEPEVKFKKVAHAFPESIGNKVLATHYECDNCNLFFGKTIENDYSKFFELHHSIMMVSGKGGKRKCKFKIPCDKRTEKCGEHCFQIDFKGIYPYILVCYNVPQDILQVGEDRLRISAPIGTFCPIAVFKTFVKMAITVMPVEEVNLFSDAISWILNPKHENFYKSKKLLIRYQMIPGFNVTKFPHFFLYRRRFNVLTGPYMLFNLTYGCFSFLIEVPRNGNIDDRLDDNSFERIPFPPIPFYISQEGIWDMSAKELSKGEKFSIFLNAGGFMKIDKSCFEMINGKPVFKDNF
ncbi:HNH endonuclease [Succinivibrio dextrinosolvens]|uniref:HNH endonuclease n=1 Tax=Succinivibrio dextrinosolvens TaxID=83771 RepID=UPI0004E1C846|nr:HNH endonuclease [Succinivibrio dextrinosolvens]